VTVAREPDRPDFLRSTGLDILVLASISVRCQLPIFSDPMLCKLGFEGHLFVQPAKSVCTEFPAHHLGRHFSTNLLAADGVLSAFDRRHQRLDYDDCGRVFQLTLRLM
jgi:hypothetical protein